MAMSIVLTIGWFFVLAGTLSMLLLTVVQHLALRRGQRRLGGTSEIALPPPPDDAVHFPTIAGRRIEPIDAAPGGNGAPEQGEMAWIAP